MNSILNYVQGIACEAIVEKTEELMENFREEFGYEDLPDETLFTVINFVLLEDFAARVRENYA